jgi:hypothetical protein
MLLSAGTLVGPTIKESLVVEDADVKSVFALMSAAKQVNIKKRIAALRINRRIMSSLQFHSHSYLLFG